VRLCHDTRGLTHKPADNHLYIGTSAGEILHLVSFPSEEGDDNDTGSNFILASRLQPSGHAISVDATPTPGTQQILVLPGPMRACVLCNGVVSFYSLPEFTPVFQNREPTGVQWIGGIDENEDRDNPEGQIVMIASARRIRQVRVGERLKAIKNSIEYPGCVKSCRRDTIACVADETTYALLEVEHQQKIPLFPISSQPLEDLSDSNVDGGSRHDGDERNPSPGHGRSTSMGNLVGSPADRPETPHRQQDSKHLQPPGGDGEAGRTSPGPSGQGFQGIDEDSNRPKTRPRSSTETLLTRSATPTRARKNVGRLKPHIVSPFPTEFMLTTGTRDTEPGVGMFVNLDGEVVRGTIEFESYPEDVIVSSFGAADDMASGRSEEPSQVIIALVKRVAEGEVQRELEFQQLQDEPIEGARSSVLVPLPKTADDTIEAGLHRTLSLETYSFRAVGDLLQLVPLRLGLARSPPLSTGGQDSDPRTKSAVEQLEQERALFDNQSSSSSPSGPSADVVDRRAAEEAKLSHRFGRASTRNIVWNGDRLLMILPNPLILQLESQLMQSVKGDDFQGANAKHILGFLASIHGREPKDETEFLTLNYIRQKASLILSLHVLSHLHSDFDIEEILKPVENTLHDGGVDPRIILLLVPPLAGEVLYGPEGIWVNQGLAHLMADFTPTTSRFEDAPPQFWMMVRHFLTLWQEKRGYGSIADEKYVFDTVDAALLHVLLYLDQSLPPDSAPQKSVKAKLNNVVDHWKGDFDRATTLLERHHRLFVLSRLYQSRKLARDVLGTWKRIVDGEKDVEYESNPQYVEAQVRRYLGVIRDADLVQEYGLWLAQRNPDLAVQLFSDDSTRVKFTPQQVIPLLKQHAPGAVQQYLEHLVFGKHLDKYADDLIGYYLDSVLTVLERSEDARESLAESYSTYRALATPKPTYLDFINQNAPVEPWWQSRLRLLQLLGSGGYATSGTMNKDLGYSVPMVLERMAPFSSYLVSEAIILDARQGRHKAALRLLTHGLGDFDTAIRYCYFGGPAPSSSQTIDISSVPSREMQQELFEFLLHEFLSIADVEECLERTSHLLGKFATWFDPLKVVARVPDHWGVDVLSEFLLRSFRAATSERNQAVILKAISASQNLQQQAEFVEMCEKIGAQVQTGQENVDVSATAPVDMGPVRNHDHDR